VIIVTGTKRSGTSLWMQLLIAAGFPAFGEAFPGAWKRTLGSANPDGFYESNLRQGIYYATRRYAVHVESYGRLLEDPDSVVRQVLDWLGNGDVEQAIARVKPALRHHEGPEADGTVDRASLDVFRELYRTIDDRRSLLRPCWNE
jgi:hypothetical protein